MALITLLETKDGGKAEPVRVGYSPNHNFFGADNLEMAIGLVVLPDGVELHPGESIETLVRFFPWSRLAGELYPEREWIIQEGPRVVGFGRVVEVVRSP